MRSYPTGKIQRKIIESLNESGLSTLSDLSRSLELRSVNAQVKSLKRRGIVDVFSGDFDFLPDDIKSEARRLNRYGETWVKICNLRKGNSKLEKFKIEDVLIIQKVKIIINGGKVVSLTPIGDTVIEKKRLPWSDPESDPVKDAEDEIYGKVLL